MIPGIDRPYTRWERIGLRVGQTANVITAILLVAIIYLLVVKGL